MLTFDNNMSRGQLNTDFTSSLFRLKQNLLLQNKSLSQQFQCSRKEHLSDDILKKIENVVEKVVKDISAGISPTFSYESTSAWTDVSFEVESGIEMRRNQRITTIRFESLQSVKKFGLMMKVLAIMYRLVKTNQFCTKRDIFYQDPTFFTSQHVLDVLVDNISCMLCVPRWELHVLATSKGCIAGDLIFQDGDNNYIDCNQTQMGLQVPNHVTGIHIPEQQLSLVQVWDGGKARSKDMVTKAMFILVVEKDATFQKLIEARICEKLRPCIVITGKGFPDVNTRLLLRKLWDNFAIPILALVDADPHGMEIMAVYKFGSKALSFETDHLAVPCLKWLGLLPTDISRLGIPKTALISLSKTDREKCFELLHRPYMQHFPQWKNEVEILLSTDQKAEIQALDSIASGFLIDVYLPSKLRCSGWI